MFGLRGRGARTQSFLRSRVRRFENLEERLALTGAPTVTQVAVSSTQWSAAYVCYLEQNSLGTAGYSIPVGSNSQTAALPWSNLDQIRITFSEDVNVQKNDLALTGVNTASYAFSNFFYDPQTRVAIWTLSAPIGKDRLLLDLDGDGVDPVADLAGNALDGEWVNNSDTFQYAGNGAAGGDFEFLFNVLPGEVNSTSQVTSSDYFAVFGKIGKTTTTSGYNFKCDVDGSGLIDSTDSQFVLANVYNTLPTGNPVGTSNDAPSAKPIAAVPITNAAIDQVISLWDNFGDNETSDASLTYSIAENTASSLLDYATIDTLTGQLKLNTKANVSGSGLITISATDAGGLSTKSTIKLNIGNYNQPPIIIYPVPEDLGNNRWRISGTVTDDQTPTGLLVRLFGTVSARAAVYSDGTFTVVIDMSGIPSGWEYMEIDDGFGGVSDEAAVYVGV